MKNRFIKLTTLALLTTPVLASCGNEEKPHVHVFDKQVIGEAYEVKAVKCEEAGEYYFSCECGEIGTETFIAAPLGHSFTNYVEESNGVYVATCDRCTETDTIYGDYIAAPVVFNKENQDSILSEFIGEISDYDFYWLPVKNADGYLVEINGEIQSIGNPIVDFEYVDEDGNPCNFQYCLYQFDSSLPVGDYTLRFSSYKNLEDRQFVSSYSRDFVVINKQAKLPVTPSCFGSGSTLIITNSDTYYYELDFGEGRIYNAIKPDNSTYFAIDLSEVVFEDGTTLEDDTIYHILVTGIFNAGRGETLTDFYFEYSHTNTEPILKSDQNGENVKIFSTTKKVEIYLDDIKGTYYVNSTNTFEYIDFSEIIFEDEVPVEDNIYLIKAISISDKMKDSKVSNAVYGKYTILDEAPSIEVSNNYLVVLSETNIVKLDFSNGSVYYCFVTPNEYTIVNPKFLTKVSGNDLVEKETYVFIASSIDEDGLVSSKETDPKLYTYELVEEDDELLELDWVEEDESCAVYDKNEHFFQNPVVGLKVGDVEFVTKLNVYSQVIAIDDIIHTLDVEHQHKLGQLVENAQLSLKVKVFFDDTNTVGSNYSDENVYYCDTANTQINPVMTKDDDGLYIKIVDDNFYTQIKSCDIVLAYTNEVHVGTDYGFITMTTSVEFDEETLTYTYFYSNQIIPHGGNERFYILVLCDGYEFMFDGVDATFKLAINSLCLQSNYVTWKDTGDADQYVITIGESSFVHTMDDIDYDPYFFKSGDTYYWDAGECSGSLNNAEVEIVAYKGTTSYKSHSELIVNRLSNDVRFVQDGDFILFEKNIAGFDTDLYFLDKYGNMLHPNDYSYLFSDSRNAYSLSELSTYDVFVVEARILGNNLNYLTTEFNELVFGYIDIISATLSKGHIVTLESTDDNYVVTAIGTPSDMYPTGLYTTNCESGFDLYDLEEKLNYGVDQVVINKKITHSIGNNYLVYKPVSMDVYSARVVQPVVNFDEEFQRYVIDSVVGSEIEIIMVSENDFSTKTYNYVSPSYSATYFDVLNKVETDFGNKFGVYDLYIRNLGNGDIYSSKPVVRHYDYVDASPLTYETRTLTSPIYDGSGWEIANSGDSILVIDSRTNITQNVTGPYSSYIMGHQHTTYNSDLTSKNDLVYRLNDVFLYAGCSINIQPVCSNYGHDHSQLPESVELILDQVDVKVNQNSYKYYCNVVDFMKTFEGKVFISNSEYREGVLTSSEPHVYKYAPVDLEGNKALSINSYFLSNDKSSLVEKSITYLEVDLVKEGENEMTFIFDNCVGQSYYGVINKFFVKEGVSLRNFLNSHKESEEAGFYYGPTYLNDSTHNLVSGYNDIALYNKFNAALSYNYVLSTRVGANNNIYINVNVDEASLNDTLVVYLDGQVYFSTNITFLQTFSYETIVIDPDKNVHIEYTNNVYPDYILHYNID